MKSSISSKSFSETMMTVTKQGVKGRCLSTGQVIELMSLFSFEKDKLDLAKYLYDFTGDRQNYYRVNDVFSFSSSISELNNYIENK
jgi:hypothetical protein